ncbi:hypothetical protein [Rhodoferax sp. BLA1]|uniref:hypothetical protein n=1 Tax=Rhodoferax sp. BLA1 TaxID=2576062 RepID=UPI0015D3B1E0|nr:hypothetical protein [Rhodoferax sp. BLA1]
MNHPRRNCITGLGLTCLLALPAYAQLPQRNLIVDVRQVEAGNEGGYSASTTREALMTAQTVSVRNGEKASFHVSKSMPMQWVQSVSVQSASMSAPGVSASNTGGGVTNGLVWLEAGQSLQVQPHWPGGKQPVRLDIDVQSTSVGHRTGTELPDQSKSQLVTTVNAPLGQWVTVAISGSAPQAGVYSSQAAANSQRLLQIRVLAP